MKTNKNLCLTLPKFKTQTSFRIIALLIIALIAIYSSGCSKDDDNEYYVKYEVDSKTIYYGGKLNVTVKTEANTNATYIIDTRSKWEIIVGPVRKGFNATLHVEQKGSDNHLKLYTQISVSKNGDPFVLKSIDGSDEPRDSVYLNYKIE
jgi:hypothetical protein